MGREGGAEGRVVEVVVGSHKGGSYERQGLSWNERERERDAFKGAKTPL